MQRWLWMIPALPFTGFLLLALVGERLSRRVVAFIATGAVGLSAVAAGLTAISFLSAEPAANSYSQTIWVWLD